MRPAAESENISQTSALAEELRLALSKLIRRVREHANPGDLTSAQKSVIHRIERDGPITVSELARAESVRPQSMRVTVAGLEVLGLVTGKQDPADGRQTFFSLTAACRAALRKGRSAQEDWLQRALQAQSGPHERKQLAAAIDLLNRLADYQPAKHR